MKRTANAKRAMERLPTFGKTLGASLGAIVSMAAITVSPVPAKADPRAVVELFTSQGCSSCPPADKVLGDLSKEPGVIALSLPIDYWDYLGWKDTLADSRFTARQKAYSHMRGDRDVYTPQAVVNGTSHVLGSDRASIDKAAQSKTNGIMSVPVTMIKANSQIKVSVAADSITARQAEVWICAVSKEVTITINRGENRGKAVTYHNVVRNMLKVGDWDGKTMSWNVPLENIQRDGVDAAVVYVQDGNRDKPGAMLGAAFAELK